MGRYIDKDKVLKIVNDMTECEDDYKRITNWVHNMPTIDIVRCKECKYGDTGTDEDGNLFWKCLGRHYGGTNPDDFCSYGEREGE